MLSAGAKRHPRLAPIGLTRCAAAIQDADLPRMAPECRGFAVCAHLVPAWRIPGSVPPNTILTTRRNLSQTKQRARGRHNLSRASLKTFAILALSLFVTPPPPLRCRCRHCFPLMAPARRTHTPHDTRSSPSPSKIPESLALRRGPSTGIQARCLHCTHSPYSTQTAVPR